MKKKRKKIVKPKTNNKVAETQENKNVFLTVIEMLQQM